MSSTSNVEVKGLTSTSKCYNKNFAQTHINANKGIYVAHAGPIELYEKIKDTIVQDKVDVSSGALARILETLKACITISDKPAENLNAVCGPQSRFETLRREAILKRQAQIQGTNTSIQADADGYGPPVAFDRAFYFHHTELDFTSILPAADISQYELRSSKKRTAPNSTREAAHETAPIHSSHLEDKKTSSEAFDQASLKIPQPDSPSLVHCKLPVRKDSEHVGNSSDDGDHVNTADKDVNSSIVATQEIPEAFRGNLIIAYADHPTQGTDSTYGSQSEHYASHNTHTQKYLDFIKPIFSRPAENAIMEADRSSSRATRATSLPNYSPPISSVLGKRSHDSTTSVSGPSCKRIKLSK